MVIYCESSSLETRRRGVHRVLDKKRRVDRKRVYFTKVLRTNPVSDRI